MVPPPRPFSDEAKNRPAGVTAMAGSAAPFEQSVEPGHAVPAGLGGVADTVKSVNAALGAGFAPDAPPAMASTAASRPSTGKSFFMRSPSNAQIWAHSSYPPREISKPLVLALFRAEPGDEEAAVPADNGVRAGRAASHDRVDIEAVAALVESFDFHQLPLVSLEAALRESVDRPDALRAALHTHDRGNGGVREHAARLRTVGFVGGVVELANDGGSGRARMLALLLGLGRSSRVAARQAQDGQKNAARCLARHRAAL